MEDFYVLFLFFIIWLLSFIKLFKRDKFYAIFYAALFLYVFPCLIVYKYLPFVMVDYYAGESYYYSFLFFVFISMLTLFATLNFHIKHPHKSIVKIVKGRYSNSTSKIVLFGIFLFTLVETYFVVKNAGDISYKNMVFNYQNKNINLTILSYLYEISKLLIVVMSAKTKKSIFFKFLLIYMIILYSLYSFMVGDRSGLVAIVVGLFIVYYKEKKIKMKQLISLGIGGYFILIFLNAMLAYRKGDADTSKTLIESLLIGDYTYPALYIPQMIKIGYIDPLELIISNLLNSIIFTNYPYMYIIAGEKFTDVLSASEGLGFHLFTEGFIFAGYFGFIWNGCFIGWCMSLWRRFCNTNNESFNTAILAVMSTYIIQIARSTGSLAFVKEFYLFIIPSAILFCILNNVKMKWARP